MSKFTDYENLVIDGFNTHRYSFFDDGITEGSDTWVSVFLDEVPLDRKISRGVISSLIQKGFFNSGDMDGDVYLTLTDDAVAEIKSRRA